MRTQLSSRFVDTYRSTEVLRGTLLKPRSVWPNEWDGCLLYDKLAMDEMLSRGGLSGCCPQWRRPYIQPPYISMPDGGRKFKPIGTLAVPDLTDPANLNVDLPVLTVQVPNGYDGVITDVVCQISGPGGGGLVEGSGDATWRLAAGGISANVNAYYRYLRDMGAITTSLGSLTSPSLVLYGGLRVYSDNWINFTVNFSNAASGTINPNGVVICSIFGWYYPRSGGGM